MGTYIAKKKIKGKTYLYERESYRDPNNWRKVLTRTIRYLGPGTIEGNTKKVEGPADADEPQTVRLEMTGEFMRERQSEGEDVRLFSSDDVGPQQIDLFFEEYHKLPPKMQAEIKEVLISSKPGPIEADEDGYKTQTAAAWVEPYNRLVVLDANSEIYAEDLPEFVRHEAGHGVFEKELKLYYDESDQVREEAAKKFPNDQDKAEAYINKKLSGHKVARFAAACDEEGGFSVWVDELKKQAIEEGDLEKEAEFYSEVFAEATNYHFKSYNSYAHREQYFNTHRKTYTVFKEIIGEWEK